MARLRSFVIASRLLALERLVASVRAHVALEGLGCAELVVAFRALACLVASVRLHVSVELRALSEARAVGREGETTAARPAADEAEGFGERRGMHRLDVRLECGFSSKGFPAGRRGRVVVPLADGDGEVRVGLGGRS